MKHNTAFLLSLFAAAAMTSCVVPGDIAYSAPGIGFRQYGTLPAGYSGDAYLYGGRYYSGGRYENGSFHDQGRSYSNRYYHDGRYYYGGSHQHYGSRSPALHAGHDPRHSTSFTPGMHPSSTRPYPGSYSFR